MGLGWCCTHWKALLLGPGCMSKFRAPGGAAITVPPPNPAGHTWLHPSHWLRRPSLVPQRGHISQYYRSHMGSHLFSAAKRQCLATMQRSHQSTVKALFGRVSSADMCCSTALQGTSHKAALLSMNSVSRTSHANNARPKQWDANACSIRALASAVAAEG